jgi:parvulin-like peptidyl-prolyl isomerase
MSIFLGLVLLLLLLAVCGFLAWGTAAAANSALLAAGIAIDQITTAVLALALVAVVGLTAWVAVKAFSLGRALERRNANDDLNAMQRQLDRARARSPHVMQPIVLTLRAPQEPQEPKASPTPGGRRTRTLSRRQRVALGVAKRWFR